MYIGYELLDLKKNSFNCDFSELLENGRQRYAKIKSKIEARINSFVLQGGNLDGAKMQANWFPQISTDVFISHSHSDEELAIAFSQWVYEAFGLDVFIDSCIWGYAGNLLKLIDNEYCLNPSGDTYNYNKRNDSTSHVHMMLSTALSMMIDKAECIIFLNTPNSIIPNEVISKTKSPWIYSEIAMTRLIRQKPIKDYRIKRLTESFSKGEKIEDKTLTVEYAIDKDHLNELTTNNLCEWKSKWIYRGKKYSSDYKQHILDLLYQITSNNMSI